MQIWHVGSAPIARTAAWSRVVWTNEMLKRTGRVPVGALTSAHIDLQSDEVGMGWFYTQALALWAKGWVCTLTCSSVKDAPMRCCQNNSHRDLIFVELSIPTSTTVSESEISNTCKYNEKHNKIVILVIRAASDQGLLYDRWHLTREKVEARLWPAAGHVDQPFLKALSTPDKAKDPKKFTPRLEDQSDKCPSKCFFGPLYTVVSTFG